MSNDIQEQELYFVHSNNKFKSFYAYTFVCMYPLFLIPRSPWPETMKT